LQQKGGRRGTSQHLHRKRGRKKIKGNGRHIGRKKRRKLTSRHFTYAEKGEEEGKEAYLSLLERKKK